MTSRLHRCSEIGARPLEVAAPVEFSDKVLNIYGSGAGLSPRAGASATAVTAVQHKFDTLHTSQLLLTLPLVMPLQRLSSLLKLT